MKRLSWKYMAGLIDGEGCIDFQYVYQKPPYDKGRKYITPRVRITLAAGSKFLLEMVQNNYGGALNEKKNGDTSRWQTPFMWQIQGKKIRPFLQNIVKHLLIKQEQARFCIWIIDNVMGKQVGSNVTQCAIDELKAMKRDPHRLSERAEKEVKSLMRQSE